MIGIGKLDEIIKVNFKPGEEKEKWIKVRAKGSEGELKLYTNHKPETVVQSLLLKDFYLLENKKENLLILREKKGKTRVQLKLGSKSYETCKSFLHSSDFDESELDSLISNVEKSDNPSVEDVKKILSKELIKSCRPGSLIYSHSPCGLEALNTASTPVGAHTKKLGLLNTTLEAQSSIDEDKPSEFSTTTTTTTKCMDSQEPLKSHISKHRLSKKSVSMPVKLKKLLFGGDLVDIFELENGHFPLAIEEMICAIQRYGINTPGIYRESCNNADLIKLKSSIIEGTGPDWEQFPLMDVHLLCCTVKCFLREIRHKVIPYEIFKTFTDSDPNQSFSSIRNLLTLLPLQNRAVIFRVVKHLKCISLNCINNKMDIYNLSVVFGPTLVDTGSGDSYLSISVVKSLIDNIRELTLDKKFMHNVDAVLLNGPDNLFASPNTNTNKGPTLPGSSVKKVLPISGQDIINQLKNVKLNKSSRQVSLNSNDWEPTSTCQTPQALEPIDESVSLSNTADTTMAGQENVDQSGQLCFQLRNTSGMKRDRKNVYSLNVDNPSVLMRSQDIKKGSLNLKRSSNIEILRSSSPQVLTTSSRTCIEPRPT